eukprot:7045422-Pyramimonas_sp.AAC.1
MRSVGAERCQSGHRRGMTVRVVSGAIENKLPPLNATEPGSPPRSCLGIPPLLPTEGSDVLLEWRSSPESFRSS